MVSLGCEATGYAFGWVISLREKENYRKKGGKMGEERKEYFTRQKNLVVMRIRGALRNVHTREEQCHSNHSYTEIHQC